MSCRLATQSVGNSLLGPLLLGFLFFMMLSCGTGKTDQVKKDSVKEKYANQIKSDDLKEHLFLLSSDILEGRKTGEKRQEMAVERRYQQ